MIRSSAYLTFFLMLMITGMHAQCSFAPPLNGQIRLSGTFGELRGNHFHAGIDIKSPTGQSGHPILAVEDGYVTRINIKSDGYGNSIYINHACGMTSVYAHLREFERQIDSTVNAWQYIHQSFELDTLLSDSLFIVRQGDIIGYMGTTGYSFGAHLHFEIRNTITDRPSNPLATGWEVIDNISPVINKLYLYAIDRNYNIKDRIGINRNNKKESKYLLDTVFINQPQFGVGIEAYDQLNNTPNKNGIHSISIKVDNEVSYYEQFDSLDFDYKNYYFAHVDHKLKIEKNKNIYRCFYFDKSYPNIISQAKDHGICTVDSIRLHDVVITMTDYAGNEANARLTVGHKNFVEVPKADDLGFLINNSKPIYFDLDSFGIFIDSFSLEKSQYIKIDMTKDSSQHILSNIFKIGEPSHTLIKPIKLHFDVTAFPDSIKKRLFIMRCKKNQHVNIGGQIEGDFLVVWANNLGQYGLMIDSISSSIEPINFEQDWSGKQYISFKVIDNYPDSDEADPLTIDAFLDGQWILMKYDKKNDLIRYDFDHQLCRGQHSFRLQIRDSQGNLSNFDQQITY